ncbi:hypothetical protein CPAST_c11480 [Clostridium pasteurianum DSM 525 = ATCC 6013]|uniref:FMN-binding domain protein n=1 Tax=Clostridium pasteurianum DSM 525 = ATCC 6013 TaxID=1262449 RepID=A0A0H3J5S0_CLOPA|nr:FMN-binding protein [Clostridium pasteurianum]AJA47248.1 hypothetical protein CPAST_c11480 [Clostridium pasteurianum DSM 525 = ATCC 6013]AJA51236.1 hypothetical protein CLPA_c11480 [Clostridium pasteurianum DSM 525 = ATCC 6013]AOZ74598.1 hypothetical protein AQ983_05550 [Clostridium pasteurianum DSM 525 = ATCC 6013]AOZ78395.1 hypothetical protein AQ984_05540 [Clostridium pasteurianum]ELP59369.1 FMN-binding domain-containing protein [Clostridium pasteurianum DSM 525 = ATCC 6013]
MKRLKFKSYFYAIVISLVIVLLLLGSKFIKSQGKIALRSNSTIIFKGEEAKSNSSINSQKLKAESIKNLYKDGRYTGTSAGYKDNFILDVTVKDNKVTDINIISYEDGIEYVKQAAIPISDKIISAQSTDVDTVSGATTTSNGVKAAVKNALLKATYKDGTYNGKGIEYTTNKFVNVNVIIKKGKIDKLDLISQDEIPEFDKAWTNVTNKIIKSQSTMVDAVTGATYASNGIINAVYNGISKAETLGAVSTYPSKDQIIPPFKDGKYVGKDKEGNPVVEVTVKNNKIEKLDLKINDENSEYLKKAGNSIADEIVKKQLAEVDAVSGATKSSNELIIAVKDALRNAKDW